MIGYAALRQPEGGSPQVMLRQGIGVPHAKKTRLIQDVRITRGTTYHVTYIYDIAGRSASLVLTQKGLEVARLPAVPLLEPSAAVFRFAVGDKLTIDLSTRMGENDPAAAESPSIGWTYQKMQITLYPGSEG